MPTLVAALEYAEAHCRPKDKEGKEFSEDLVRLGVSKFGLYFGAVAVMGSTTHALYTVIMARQWAAGAELIISNLEHVCIASAAQGLESQYGVVIKAVAADRGDDTFVAELERALSPRTRLVAFS